MRGAGGLKQRIALRRAVVAPNAFNEPVETWSTLATVWAERRDASAGEGYRAQEVGARITTRFTIRYSSEVADLTPRDRVSFGGLIYDITAVRASGRNDRIEIDAVARPDLEAQGA